MNVSNQEIHANLWPTFKKLLETTDAAAGWKYEESFKFALDSMKSDYNLSSNSLILKDKNIQSRFGFHFIIHCHHH
jgi:hypothetical protein